MSQDVRGVVGGDESMDVVWDGVTRVETLGKEVAQKRSALADAAKHSRWPEVFELLGKDGNLINCCRPGGRALYAPVHQAAFAGAPVTVVQQLVRLGAWRTLRNAAGERAADVADRRRQHHLLGVLAPVYQHRIPIDVLRKLQRNFHRVIEDRVADLVRKHSLRLPELEPLLELERPRMWFPVPGMYGGFSYQLKVVRTDPELEVESWCRVMGGSGQRHEVSVDGARLVEEGFV